MSAYAILHADYREKSRRFAATDAMGKLLSATSLASVGYAVYIMGGVLMGTVAPTLIMAASVTGLATGLAGAIAGDYSKAVTQKANTRLRAAWLQQNAQAYAGMEDRYIADVRGMIAQGKAKPGTRLSVDTLGRLAMMDDARLAVLPHWVRAQVFYAQADICVRALRLTQQQMNDAFAKASLAPLPQNARIDAQAAHLQAARNVLVARLGRRTFPATFLPDDRPSLFDAQGDLHAFRTGLEAAPVYRSGPMRWLGVALGSYLNNFFGGRVAFTPPPVPRGPAGYGDLDSVASMLPRTAPAPVNALG